MSDQQENLWRGLTAEARAALEIRDYSRGSLGSAVAGSGVEARQLVGLERGAAEISEFWIPGVEIFGRTIYPQRHRGVFGELGRRDEAIFTELGLWPQQWAAARMFAETAKGFHIHPPSIPDGVAPGDWLRKLFIESPRQYALRRYEHEQWDVMYILQGVVDMILRDLREGLPRKTMRFIVDGDNHRGPNNVGVVIPPGVAHALRAEGSEDVVMVYGTTTSFHPEFEGRIASDIEHAPLPESWQRVLAN
jgi:dTDP-4-dehydrorhamnose 3,5-epimerase-like enzyme